MLNFIRSSLLLAIALLAFSITAVADCSACLATTYKFEDVNGLNGVSLKVEFVGRPGSCVQNDPACPPRKTCNYAVTITVTAGQSELASYGGVAQATGDGGETWASGSATPPNDPAANFTSYPPCGGQSIVRVTLFYNYPVNDHGSHGVNFPNGGGGFDEPAPANYWMGPNLTVYCVLCYG